MRSYLILTFLFYGVVYADPTIRMKFLESDGSTTFLDSSGNGNDGTCSAGTCPVYSTGVDFRAVEFDGNDDGITISDAASLDPTTDYTFSAWINVNSGYGDSNNPGIAAKRDAGWGGIWIQRSDGKLWGRFWQSDLTQANLPKNYTVPTGQWLHLVQLADSSATTCYQYINADQKGSVAYDGTIRSGSANLTLGRQNSENLNGRMANVTTWNVALSRTQIRALFFREARQFYPNFPDSPPEARALVRFLEVEFIDPLFEDFFGH